MLRCRSALLVFCGFELALAFGAAGQEDPARDVHRPAAIETSAVPAVGDEVVEHLREFGNVRSAAFAGWAPRGDGILIATRFGNSTQLHRVYEPGGRREQITFYDEPVGGGFIRHAPDNALLLSMSQGGDENYQLYYLDPVAYRAVLLTDGRARHRLDAMRPDGRQMILASNRRNGRDTDLYVADPRVADSARMLWPADGEYWSAADWSPVADTLLLQRYVSINESYFALYDLGTGNRTDLALPGNEPAAIGNLVFSRDGRSILLTTDASSEFRRLARYDLGTGEYQWLSADVDWDVSDVAVDEQSERIAFAVNADGASRLYLLEGERRRGLEIPLGIVSRLEFSPDGQQLGFTLSRPDAPPDAYSWHLDDGRLIRWTFSEVGGLDPASFVVPTRVQFPSFDGRMIPAYYYRPKTATAERPAAVLVSIHGGPESQYRPFFSSIAQYHVGRQGLAVICPNVRGSAGYGKTYLKLDNAERREDSVKDIGALLDWISTQPELDASRVVVSGASYGGYMVLAALAHFPERIKAGIDVVGIANFITFLDQTAAYRQDLRRAEYGDERHPDMRAVFERINPAANVDRIRSALLVAHGRNDPRVPFSEAQQIADRVRSLGRTVWTVYADNEGHGFSKKDNADYLRAVEVLFLREQLGLE